MCALSGELVINLSAIQHNYSSLNAMSHAACETAVAVKADCYGLGAAQVVPALYQAGARTFFVATIDEGIEVRELLPDVDIFTLNGLWISESKTYSEYRLMPVLNSLPEIDAYQGAAAVHFDTGMNRLGLTQREANIVCDDPSRFKNIDIRYIMSHFASADEHGNPDNQEQYKRFYDIKKHFKDVKASLSNSGGLFLSRDYHMDLTRPGIALYGGNPLDGDVNPMRPVITLHAPVLQIRSLQKGEPVGYSGTYICESDTRLAVLSIGYADGVLRSLADDSVVHWKGYELPVRGRVSMDSLICDLCNVPEKDYPKIGDLVELMGRNQSLDHFAKQTGTISYEILTSLGSRYKRVYTR